MSELGFNMDLLLKSLNIDKRVTPSDVHVDRPLTNISVAYMQAQTSFVADRIFPRVAVQKQSDRYWTYDPSFWNRSEVRPRPPSSESLGGAMAYGSDSYFAEVFAIHMNVDDRIVANADAPLSPRNDATEWVTFQLLLFRELTWVNKYFIPGIWPNQEVGAATGVDGTSVTFWNTANADPVGDVKRWKNKVHLASGGIRPNVMVMSRLVYDALTECPAIIDRIKYGQTPGAPAQVSKANLAALFEIDRIEILDAIQNTAREGATAVNAYIAGKHVALYYVPPSMGLMTPSSGATFVWSGYIGSVQGQRISATRMENIRSDRIEGELCFDMKVTGATTALFCSGVVQ